MVNESFLSLACAGLIGILFGLALTFVGYRLFRFLLPIWGFIFGLMFGAQTLQALFGEGFLSTVTSWVVGFVVGLAFAALAYLFYTVAIAILGGSLGYAVAVGLLTWIGLPMGFLVWLIGMVAGVALAIVTLALNLQKWVAIIATAVLGAGTIIGSMALMFNPMAEIVKNPVKVLLQTSPFLAIIFIVLAAVGIWYQARTNVEYKVEEYSGW